MPTASKENHNLASQAIAATRSFGRRVGKLDFSEAVPWVYNPLEYASELHRQYLLRYLRPTCRVIFLGMNPGPWGMAQTGIPFGEVLAVREWLGIDGPVRRPVREHPKRPIQGLDCPRSEVSGKRLWGLFAKRFGMAERFFEEHFVANYCPLVFMEESARNVTPDKLPAVERQALEQVCDEYLGTIINLLQPEWVIGVGGWAEGCASRVVSSRSIRDVQIGRILHPSPASPAANRDWAGTATKQMRQLGVWVG
jgi:single-strand selective monofunctional uracil DNA glycosylase